MIYCRVAVLRECQLNIILIPNFQSGNHTTPVVLAVQRNRFSVSRCSCNIHAGCRSIIVCPVYSDRKIPFCGCLRISRVDSRDILSVNYRASSHRLLRQDNSVTGYHRCRQLISLANGQFFKLPAVIVFAVQRNGLAGSRNLNYCIPRCNSLPGDIHIQIRFCRLRRCGRLNFRADSYQLNCSRTRSTIDLLSKTVLPDLFYGYILAAFIKVDKGDDLAAGCPGNGERSVRILAYSDFNCFVRIVLNAANVTFFMDRIDVCLTDICLSKCNCTKVYFFNAVPCSRCDNDLRAFHSVLERHRSRRFRS